MYSVQYLYLCERFAGECFGEESEHKSWLLHQQLLVTDGPQLYLPAD